MRLALHATSLQEVRPAITQIVKSLCSVLSFNLCIIQRHRSSKTYRRRRGSSAKHMRETNYGFATRTHDISHTHQNAAVEVCGEVNCTNPLFHLYSIPSSKSHYMPLGFALLLCRLLCLLNREYFWMDLPACDGLSCMSSLRNASTPGQGHKADERKNAKRLNSMGEHWP